MNLLNLILGFGFALTGLFAFWLPDTFFSLLPSYYGAFNLHFVKDAGLAFFSSGTLFLLALRFSEWRLPLTLGGALFIVLHGLFHVSMLIMGMAESFLDLMVELIVIIAPSFLALVLLIVRYKENQHIKT